MIHGKGHVTKDDCGRISHLSGEMQTSPARMVATHLYLDGSIQLELQESHHYDLGSGRH